MLGENNAAFLDDDFIQYLKYEAERRSMTVEEIYEEEMACQKLAEKQAFTRTELEALVEASHPDQRLLEGEEQYPF
jgi:hypothetical protein